jgi:two-component system response regulator FixJ
LSKTPVIAIVDDDEAIRDALSDFLMLEGYACRPFERAADFLATIGQESFDCLITDMRMPGMNGLELLERLHDRGSALPVIVLSSVVDEHSPALGTRCRALGMRAWLSKPIANQILLGELRRALQDGDIDSPQGSVE